jgi:FkbM family methyltransferase
MKKVFIDCGGNKGQGLRTFIEKYKIDDTWLIKTFEPNPLCNLSENIKDLVEKLNIEIFNCAIFDYNGTIKFSQMLENDEGSSVNCLMSKGACSDPKSLAYRKHDSIIEIQCRDLSDILKKYSDDDYIVVKLDIEGAEFNVLRKIIKDDTITKINDLYVEWHYHYVQNEDITTCKELKNIIHNKGINLYEWH